MVPGWYLVAFGFLVDIAVFECDRKKGAACVCADAEAFKVIVDGFVEEQGGAGAACPEVRVLCGMAQLCDKFRTAAERRV
jgi:hypothetical protein